MDVSGIIGKRFGRLLALEETKDRKKRTAIRCRCDCGNEKIVVVCELVKGHTISCGCYHREMMRNKQFRHGDAGNHHGDSGSRLYHTWLGMKRRCFNKNSWAYQNYYGNRGITICEEWLDYPTFKKWALENGYRDDLTIERKDNDGNYEPENCIWIPFEEQGKNRRNRHELTFDGKTLSIREWEKELGYRRGTIRNRINYGWNIEKILTTPVKKIKRRGKCADS